MMLLSKIFAKADQSLSKAPVHSLPKVVWHDVKDQTFG